MGTSSEDMQLMGKSNILFQLHSFIVSTFTDEESMYGEELGQ